MVENIIFVQSAIDCFSAGKKEDSEYTERRVDEEGSKMLSELGIWMAEPDVEAQRTQIKVSKVTINQHMSCWDNRLRELMQEPAFAVIGPVMLADNLEKVLAGL